MKRQLIALLMAIVMVASIFTVAATTVAAATATTFSIATSTATPLVTQPFTITGTLKAGTTALTNTRVHLEGRIQNADGTWTSWSDVSGTFMNTDSAGKVSSTRTLSTTGVREYRWHFLGTSTYAAVRSSAVTVTVKVPTTLSLSATPTSVYVWQSYTFSGYLRDNNGKGLASRTLQVWVKEASETALRHWIDLTTDANGYYTHTTSDSQTCTFEMRFAGDSTYKDAKSSDVTVTVSKIPITITFNEPVMWLQVNAHTTLSGSVKSTTGLRLDGPVYIYAKPPGQAWQFYDTASLDAAGAWRYDFATGTPGVWYFYAKYGGIDAVQSATRNWGIAVGSAKIPTSMYIAHPEHVAVGQPFSVTVHLTDFHGHGISGAVKLYWGDNPNDFRSIGTVTTDRNGLYTLGDRFDIPDTYYFKAVYGGDLDRKGCTSATVSVTAP